VVVLGDAFAARWGAGLDLPAAGADGEVGDEGVLGLPGTSWLIDSKVGGRPERTPSSNLQPIPWTDRSLDLNCASGCTMAP
jgi:hypothetical protein